MAFMHAKGWGVNKSPNKAVNLFEKIIMTTSMQSEFNEQSIGYHISKSKMLSSHDIIKQSLLQAFEKMSPFYFEKRYKQAQNKKDAYERGQALSDFDNHISAAISNIKIIAQLYYHGDCFKFNICLAQNKTRANYWLYMASDLQNLQNKIARNPAGL